MEAPQLAFVGLGNMGSGMAKNIAEKGDLAKPLILFNRTKAKADELASKLASGKAVTSDDLKNVVAKSDLIFTCVGNDQAIEDTYWNALTPGTSAAGKTFVEMSTVAPETTTKLAKMIEASGAGFVACPVFGPPAAAWGGQLVPVVAGPPAEVEKVKPYLDGVIAKAVIDFTGQDPSKASLMKLVGNTFVGAMVEALAQGHTMAEKTGLGGANVHQFLEKLFPGPYVGYSNRIVTGDYYKRDEPLFAAYLAKKDVNHAVDLASAQGVDMSILKTMDKHLDKVVERSGDKGDICAIYGVVREESGLPYEN